MTVQTSNETEKVQLWASTLHLLHKYKKSSSPLYEAGFTNYKLQKNIKRNGNDFVSIDIIAWDEKRQLGCGIELTTNVNKDKDGQLDRYKAVTPDEFANQLGIDISQSVDAILSTNHDNVTKHCHITLTDSILVSNVESITDKKLADELLKCNGSSNRPPQTKFTMDPEPNDYELRNGLISPIMQMLYKQECKTAEEMTKEALDFLYEHMDFDSRHILEKRINGAMDILIKKYLPGIISYKDGMYTPLSEKKSIKKRYKNIGNEILNWINDVKSPQTKLDEYF